MDLEVTQYEDVEVVKCHNNIDAHTAPDIEPKLLDIIDNSNDNLCIDLSDVNYVSSAGIRVFLVAHRKLILRENSLYLIKPNINVTELLQLSGIENIIHIISHPCQAAD